MGPPSQGLLELCCLLASLHPSSPKSCTSPTNLRTWVGGMDEMHKLVWTGEVHVEEGSQSCLSLL